MTRTSLGAPVSTESRWSLLAGTRFVLACVVLVGHLAFIDPSPNSWTRIGSFLNQTSAVYGFLLISGYSIAASLGRSTRGFYARRVRRIWPIYLISLAVAAIVSAFMPSGAPSAAEFLIALVMLQSFLGPTVSTDAQLWTLAVEWWLYMLAPALRRRSTEFLAALIALSLCVFLLFPRPGHPEFTRNGYMLAELGWLWVAGFLYYRFRRTPLGYAILFLPIIVVLSDAWLGRAVLIGLFALVLCDDVTVPAAWRPVMTWLGDLSYPLYAIHVPVMVACGLLHVATPTVVLIASFLCAIIILHAVDFPLRALARARAGPLIGARKTVTEKR